MAEKVKKNTETHKLEKERIEKILKSQPEDNPRVSYENVIKILVEGESFQKLLLDGITTDYLKCLNPICKGFTKQEKALNLFSILKSFFTTLLKTLKLETISSLLSTLQIIQ